MSAEPNASKSSAMLQAALAFAASGCSVVPASSNGTKAPIKAWKEYQSVRANAMQIATWYKDGHPGLGIVTGAVSGNLEMLELEGRAVAAGMLDEVRDIAFASGLGDIWNVINQGYVELTPSGGIHWLYRIADEPVPGNTKLARRPGENGGVDVLAETRGEGGFVVVAPSHGSVHPSGQPWVQINGSPALIPMLSWEERNALHQVFKALDGIPSVETVKEAVTVKTDGVSPGDDFNNRASWDDILGKRGWSKVYTANGTTYWRRPGKSMGISATTGRNDGDNLYVFTTSTEFDAEKPYSKFAAIAHLEHGGNFSACAKELRRQGYGGLSVVPDLVPVGANLSSDTRTKVQGVATPQNLTNVGAATPQNLTTVSDKPTIPQTAETAEWQNSTNGGTDEPTDNVINLETGEIRERSSWWPKPLDLDNTEQEPEPEFLTRDDGANLVYRGKVNGLLGESESGKTWIALLAVQQALVKNQSVIYLDFEDSMRGIMGRLRAMGTIDHHLANLVYANPDEMLGLEASTDLYEALAPFKPDLVVLDGVNAAMTLLGLDLTSNTDATKFSQQVLRPLKRGGAGVLTIDHVPKSKENRGNYAIGAQAKRADIDGAAISVEVMAPFGRGQNGELRLTVTKDRPGHVRAASAGAKMAGSAHLRSQGENQVRIAIVPVGAPGGFRPTHLMEKVSQLLEASSSSLSKAAVEKAVGGKAEAVRMACQLLMEEGYIKVENGSRNSINMTSVRSYREVNDNQSEAFMVAQAFPEPVDNFDE